MLLNVALAEICGSTVEKGGVAGAEFSADVTFSQWFCSLINVCSSLQSYRGIWAICMNKMMFPFQRCNSVSKCSFREFLPFSVIAENHWPYPHSRFVPFIQNGKAEERHRLLDHAVCKDCPCVCRAVGG